MIYFLYAVIVLFATIIGAIAGLGGGIIIKPLFDVLSFNDASTIGILSAFAVFTMSVVSIFKQFKKDTIIKIDLVLLISFGSLVGGFCGETLFQLVRNNTVDNNEIKTIQSIVLLITLIFVIIYRFLEPRIKTYHLKNWFCIFLVGLGLGTSSIFLGIGGGPLNIVFLSLLFSFEVKESVLYSIIMVFFTQISKLIQVYVINQFLGYDLKLILWICCFALLGGYVGSHLNKKMTENSIKIVYNITIFTLLIICLYNTVIGLAY